MFDDCYGTSSFFTCKLAETSWLLWKRLTVSCALSACETSNIASNDFLHFTFLSMMDLYKEKCSLVTHLFPQHLAAKNIY